MDIHPSFGEFLKYMTLHPLESYNEHFVPDLRLCYPCAVRYDFYANFKVYDYDVNAVMRHLGIPESYYPHKLAHPGHPTEEFMSLYYGRVSADTKRRITTVLSEELDFYYSLYPEEREMHATL